MAFKVLDNPYDDAHGRPAEDVPQILLGAPGPKATAPMWGIWSQFIYPFFACPEMDTEKNKVTGGYGWPMSMEHLADDRFDSGLRRVAKEAAPLIFAEAYAKRHDDELLEVDLERFIKSPNIKPPTWMIWCPGGFEELVKILKSHKSGKRPKLPRGYIHAGRYHHFLLTKEKAKGGGEMWTFDNLVGPQMDIAENPANEPRVRNVLASLVGYLDAAFASHMRDFEMLTPKWGLPDIRIINDRVLFVDSITNVHTDVPSVYLP